MLEIKALSVRYNKGVAILNTAHYTSPRNTGVLGLVAPSGAGKTTLLRCLAGSVPPFTGEVLLSGRKIERKDVLYLPQRPTLWPHITLVESVELHANVGQNKTFDIEREAKRLHLPEESLKKRFDQLSGGQQQRGCMLAAMAMGGSALILLDEPMTGLDPSACSALLQSIKLLGKEALVIVSSHQLADLEMLEPDDTIFIRSQQLLSANNLQARTRTVSIKGRFSGRGPKIAELSTLLASSVGGCMEKKGVETVFSVSSDDPTGVNSILKYREKQSCSGLVAQFHQLFEEEG